MNSRHLLSRHNLAANWLGMPLWLFAILILSMGSYTSSAYADSISGQISGANGVALSGAAVSVFGTASDGTFVNGSATTAADGSYYIPMPAGTYDVSVSYYPNSCMDTCLSYSNDIASNLTINGAIVQNFTLPPVVTLSGTVKDSSGTGVGGATIQLNGPGSNSAVTATDGSYSMQVYAGIYAVNIGVGSNSYSVATAFSISANTTHNFVIGATGSLSGYIRNANGVALSGAEVSVYGTTSGGAYASGSATTAADGSYFIPMLPGTYYVSVSYYPNSCMNTCLWYSKSIASSLNINGAVVQNFTLPPVVTLSGTVTDSGGTGIGGASIQLSGPGSNNAVTATDGSYSMQVYEGIYAVNIEVGSSSYSVATGFNISANTTHNFVIGATGAVSGRIWKANGVALSGAEVSVYGTTSDGAYASGSAATAADGSYFIPMLPGTYDVSVSYYPNGCMATCLSYSKSIASSLNINGAVAQNFTLPPVVTLSGTVTDSGGTGVGGAFIQLNGAAGGMSTVTAADGSYSMQVYAGTYTVQIDYKTTSYPAITQFSISSNSVQNFKLFEYTCNSGTLSGQVVDDTTGQPVSNIAVVLDGGTTVYTDSGGNYSFGTLPPSAHQLEISDPRYSLYSRNVTMCNDVNLPIHLTENSTVYGTDSNSGYTAEPVNTATGNYAYTHTDFTIPGRGLPLVFTRGYNSEAASNAGATPGPLGYGWSDSFHPFLTVDSAHDVQVHWGDGKTETYGPNGFGGFTPQYGVFDTLSANAGGGYTLRKRNLTVYQFDASLKLTSVVDRNGNQLIFSYSGGQLTKATNASGRSITLSYDAAGHISTLTDALGRVVRFGYDSNNNLTSALDANGGTTKFTYDSNHQLLTIMDPRGHLVVSNSYDSQGRVQNQLDAKAGATQFAYDVANNQTTVTDALGNATVYTHDSDLRLIKRRDSDGGLTTYTYDDRGNRIAVTDRNGNTTQYRYDYNGNVTSKTDALGNVTSITYDANNNPLSRTDALGNTTTFSYDASGNLHQVTDSLGNTMTLSYDSSGLPVSITDPRGNTATFSYDSMGDLTSTRDALGDVSHFAYDAVGRRTSKTDALGRTASYTYDNNNNLVSVTDPAGNSFSLSYNANNELTAVTDRNGNTSSFVYDVKDLLMDVVDPLNHHHQMAYDALDRLVSTTDAKGHVTHYQYDAIGRLVSAVDALDNTTQYSYDPNGNLKTVTSPLGQTVTLSYDALNRRILQTDPLGNSSRVAYDALGRVTSVTDADGNATAFDYDKLGRLVKVQDANNGTVLYRYDANGNRTAMTNPDGAQTIYQYDALNRMIKEVEAAGNTTFVAYDAVGHIIQVTKPDGGNVNYGYDALDHLTSIDYPDGKTVQLSYDANGNRIGMADSLGTHTYRYDALNRMTSHQDPFGQTVGYDYDANGNRSHLIYPGNKTVSYAYDALNRMTSVTDWLGGTTSYGYDAAGRLTSKSYPNGTGAQYSYDGASRLTGLTDLGINGTILASYSLTRDPVGNITKEVRDEPLIPYLLPGDTTYSYDAENRLTAINGQGNNFDANGNQISKGADRYAYDEANRLVQSVINGQTISYQYDGVGDRYMRGANGSETHYVVDTNGPLSKTLEEIDASGSVQSYYVYGLGLAEQIDASGDISYYHYNAQGSTVAMTNASGGVTNKYVYGPFGKLENSLTQGNNPYAFLGRYGVMKDSGSLYYARARYYDADEQRFISKDSAVPVASMSQSSNRYVYTLNDPVRLIDISGYSAMEGSATNNGHSTDAMHQSVMNASNLWQGFSAASNASFSPGSNMKYLLKTANSTATMQAQKPLAQILPNSLSTNMPVSDQFNASLAAVSSASVYDVSAQPIQNASSSHQAVSAAQSSIKAQQNWVLTLIDWLLKLDPFYSKGNDISGGALQNGTNNSIKNGILGPSICVQEEVQNGGTIPKGCKNKS